MKKIIGIIFISLMFTNIGFAEMRLIENKKILSMGMSGRFATTVCVDGHKFAIFRGGIGISMVQAYEERDGKSLPAKCWK